MPAKPSPTTGTPRIRYQHNGHLLDVRLSWFLKLFAIRNSELAEMDLHQEP
jgi:hypothetical protein